MTKYNKHTNKKQNLTSKSTHTSLLCAIILLVFFGSEKRLNKRKLFLINNLQREKAGESGTVMEKITFPARRSFHLIRLGPSLVSVLQAEVKQRQDAKLVKECKECFHKC